MPGKTISAQPFAGDDGSADPAAAAALAAYAAGQSGEHAVLAALAASRLLVPVVAVLTEAEDDPVGSGPRREKTSEMAMPTVVGNDGRHAVLAFTGLDALTRWRPDARPVPVPASRVWQAAAQDADAVVIDIAGPVPLAVDGVRLAALAEGRPAPMAHEDPGLRAAATSAAAGESQVAGVRLLPGQDGGDVTLEVTLAAPSPADVTAAIQRIAAGVLAAAGGRLRRGIAVSVVAG